MLKTTKRFLIRLFALLAFALPASAQVQHLYFNVGGATIGVWQSWAEFNRTVNPSNVSLVDLSSYGNSYPVANYNSLTNPAPEPVYQAYYYYVAQGAKVGIKFTSADGLVANRVYLMRIHQWQNIGFDAPTIYSVWLQTISRTGFSSNNLGNAQILEYTVTADASGNILYEIQPASLPVFPTAVEFIEAATNSDSRRGGMFF